MLSNFKTSKIYIYHKYHSITTVTCWMPTSYQCLYRNFTTTKKISSSNPCVFYYSGRQQQKATIPIFVLVLVITRTNHVPDQGFAPSALMPLIPGEAQAEQVSQWSPGGRAGEPEEEGQDHGATRAKADWDCSKAIPQGCGFISQLGYNWQLGEWRDTMLMSLSLLLTILRLDIITFLPHIRSDVFLITE